MFVACMMESGKVLSQGWRFNGVLILEKVM